MRILVLLGLISSSFVFAGTQLDIKVGTNFEQVTYASFYADELIKEFDKELENKIIFYNYSDSILYSETYAKILGARSFIERYQGHEKVLSTASISALQIRNARLYHRVISEIDKFAIKIHKQQNRLKVSANNADVIYPSSTGAGNITGNQFPRNVWALTFDDGPRSKKTATIVDNLYRRNIRATFFMLTREAKRYYSEAMNVKNSGMNIALHSYTHPDLNKADNTKLEKEITTAKKDLESLLNIKTSVFRLPYGSGTRNSRVRKLITKNKYIHIFWNIDTLDWKDKDPKSILARTKKQMKLTPKKSGIILFHDIHAQSVMASELTMDYLLDSNFTVCTVEEVISHTNGNSEDCLLK